MKHVLSALVAAALLASPALASADQARPAHVATPLMTYSYRVIDDAGNVVGSLFATDSISSDSFRTIGYVQTRPAAPSPWSDVNTNTAQPHLLTPLDFQKAWDAQLQSISAPPAGGS
jgi:hypothetical protein